MPAGSGGWPWSEAARPLDGASRGPAAGCERRCSPCPRGAGRPRPGNNEAPASLREIPPRRRGRGRRPPRGAHPAPRGRRLGDCTAGSVTDTKCSLSRPDGRQVLGPRPAEQPRGPQARAREDAPGVPPSDLRTPARRAVGPGEPGESRGRPRRARAPPGSDLPPQTIAGVADRARPPRLDGREPHKWRGLPDPGPGHPCGEGRGWCVPERAHLQRFRDPERHPTGGGRRSAGHAPNQEGARRPGSRYGKPEGGGPASRKGVCLRAPRGRAPASDWRPLQWRRELPDNGGLQSQ